MDDVNFDGIQGISLNFDGIEGINSIIFACMPVRVHCVVFNADTVATVFCTYTYYFLISSAIFGV